MVAIGSLTLLSCRQDQYSINTETNSETNGALPCDCFGPHQFSCRALIACFPFHRLRLASLVNRLLTFPAVARLPLAQGRLKGMGRCTTKVKALFSTYVRQSP